MSFLAIITDIEGNLDTSYFKITNIGQMATRGVDAAIKVGGALALAYMLWGAIAWIMSDGDKAQLEKARNKIIHALIGFAVVVATWLIWALAQWFLLGKSYSVGGSGPGPGASCPTGTCESGGACFQAGEHACNGNTLYTCDPSRPVGQQWINPQNCGSQNCSIQSGVWGCY